MAKLGKLIASLTVSTTMIAPSLSLGQTSKMERPPQFVLFAYDGSYNNEVWNESREFSQKLKQEGVDVRFTYFINPVYLLQENNKRAVVEAPWAEKSWMGDIKISNQEKNVYIPPNKSSSATTSYSGRMSDIGVGDDTEDIRTRIEQMTDAHLEGHEIASHAVGHFDGGKWTETEWINEFLQFDFILDNVFALNKIKPSSRNADGLIFRKDIVGFRAPLLAYNLDLFKTLKRFNFKYDTSQQDKMAYWPQRHKLGHWNFPLATLPIPNSARTVPSMDYNFCVNDTARLVAQDPSLRSMKVYNAKKKTYTTPNTGECISAISPEQKAEVKKRMLDSYRNYFKNNYYGNRAPIHIGHHFSRWMSGAYYEAFFELANEVCRKPEVKCVTYRELAQYMDGLSLEQREAFRTGSFPKLPSKSWSIKGQLAFTKPFDVKAQVVLKDGKLLSVVTGSDAKKAKTIELNFNGVQYATKSFVAQDVVSLMKQDQANQIRLIVKDAQGNELQTASYRLQLDESGNIQIPAQSIEERSSLGHMMEAHADEHDNTAGH